MTRGRDFTAATTPRQRVEAACVQRGRSAVTAGCARLLCNDDDPDHGLLIMLGGPHAESVLALADEERGVHRYWFRVWAARGLLWALDDQLAPGDVVNALRSGLGDPAWRVREMCARVIARHAVGDLFGAVAALHDDPVARVRTAADRAVEALSRRDA
ncbi:MAG TPA: hypothetical protein VH442_01080 [Micromonosporaceae bacterium]